MIHKKIRAKTNENNIVNNEPFEDGFRGIWYKNEDNGLWSYNCGGLSCNDCPYYIGCHISNLSPDDVKKRISEAKERIGK